MSLVWEKCSPHCCNGSYAIRPDNKQYHIYDTASGEWAVDVPEIVGAFVRNTKHPETGPTLFPTERDAQKACENKWK